MASFWNNTSLEPKRKFRWLVEIGGLENAQFFAKTVTRPSWTLSTHPHKFINHTFNYPGRVEWAPIDLTYVDGGDPDMQHNFLRMLRNSGYNFPSSAAEASQSVTKEKATDALGMVVIKQLGADADTILDQWELTNAWISEAASDTLSYEDDGIVEVTCKIVYDWAYLQKAGKASSSTWAPTPSHGKDPS
tara:strand:+ start:20994 stop:21563 length:570 start_codon:yes stop_codon:yes gene_type:complete